MLAYSHRKNQLWNFRQYKQIMRMHNWLLQDDMISNALQVDTGTVFEKLDPRFVRAFRAAWHVHRNSFRRWMTQNARTRQTWREHYENQQCEQ
ncbi:MAG: hypothetical protein PW788_14450 [Micavibrio sp.]|nr:hypothetical protein [Micavibrio sp.]